MDLMLVNTTTIMQAGCRFVLSACAHFGACNIWLEAKRGPQHKSNTESYKHDAKVVLHVDEKSVNSP